MCLVEQLSRVCCDLMCSCCCDSGGTAEEIVPGFKFSRASYVLSLLRPHIINDLELKVRLLRLG